MIGFFKKEEEEQNVEQKTSETVNNSCEVVSKFNGNIREILNEKDGFECNTLLATDAMIKSVLHPLNIDDEDCQKAYAVYKKQIVELYKAKNQEVPEEEVLREMYIGKRKAVYETVKFNPVGSPDKNDQPRKKASSYADLAVVASAVKAYDLGLVTLKDLETYRACFINFAVAPNITSVGPDHKTGVIFNGVWYVVIAGITWLVQYKSNNSGGQQYMADLKSFTKAYETYVVGNVFKKVLGSDEVYNENGRCYEIKRLQTENPLQYATLAVDVNGSFDFPSEEELKAGQKLVTHICPDGKGLRNLINRAQETINDPDGLCSEAPEYVTRKFSEKFWTDLAPYLTASTAVDETVESNVRRTVKKYVPID